MSNVIFFTENGERFYVILNGLRQNDTPQTNVKVTDLNANFYKMKVIFEDKTLGEKNFNLAMNEGMETSFVIKKNKKDEYVLRPVSETPVAQAAPAPANQSVVVYNPNAPVYDGGTVTHQSTTTTTTTNPPPANGTGFSMGVNVGENGGNVNMNVGGGNVDYSGASSTTHTTTTTTTVTHSSNTYQDPPPPVYSTPPPPPPSYLPGYNGPVGCPVPMSPQSFSDLKSTIESKSFEDSKMTIAKQVLSNNCLLVSQVKEIMLIFSFENTRLDFAKYAYDYTYDIGNYYKVNDAFTFESSITDLNNYIGGRRH
jgi:hypothetical protein